MVHVIADTCPFTIALPPMTFFPALLIAALMSSKLTPSPATTDTCDFSIDVSTELMLGSALTAFLTVEAQPGYNYLAS